MSAPDEESCWVGGTKIRDQFQANYPTRARDMDANALNTVKTARYINGPILSAILALADGKTDEAKKAVAEKLKDLCLYKDYVANAKKATQQKSKSSGNSGLSIDAALIMETSRDMTQNLGNVKPPSNALSGNDWDSQ